MKTIKFTERRVVQDGSGTVFEAGSIHRLPDASADHWLSRKVAVEVPAEAEKKAAPSGGSGRKVTRPKARA